MRITVIGAGVIGLTSAIRLREAGFETDIVAAEPPDTTVASAQAGAIWYPYRSAQDDRAVAWGATSLEVLMDGAAAGEPGLAVREMIELLDEPQSDPWWADAARRFRRPQPSELRAGFQDGWVIETITIDVRPHLDHLLRSFVDLGGALEQRRIDSLGELAGPGHLIVNCAGVGAGELAPDPGVFPIRGQTVRMRGVSIERVTMVEQGPLAFAYVMPHGNDCVLGGTIDAGEWDRTPDDAVTEQIVGKGVLLEPALANAEIVEIRVGLRPGRAAVRLEHESLDGTPGIIHNYGHAGNGWSLAWGCADDVARMAAGVAG